MEKKKWFRFDIHVVYDVAATSPDEAEEVLYDLLPPRKGESDRIHWVEGKWEQPTPLNPEEAEEY